MLNTILNLDAFEQKFRSMFKEAPFSAALLSGDDFLIEMANEATLMLWGKDQSIIGKPFLTAMPEMKGQPPFENLKRVFQTGETYEGNEQTAYLNINGKLEKVYVNFILKAIRDDHNKILGVLAVGYNVTSQVIAKQELEQSEERFRMMADATPSIIWALTPEGLHRYLNKFAIDYLGIKPEAVAGLDWKEHIHPDDLEATQKILGDAILNKTTYRHEHRLRRNDGEYRWFLATGAPSYYSNGELYGFVGSGIDIHEARVAQEMLKKNEEMLESIVKERTLELHRSNNDLQQFAHVASHDLKEPIRKIKTFSFKLQDEFAHALNERGNSLLSKIINSSDRMFTMINGVLNYSAISSAKGDLQHVDLNRVFEDVQNDLELMIAEKKAKFQSIQLPMVYANKELVHQLFYNLVNNALKFSQTKTTPLIEISWRPTSVNGLPYVEITVNDNGIGFDNRYADEIFGTFVRLHSKDEYEGNGLGLALCKRIVERYGGSIKAESRQDVGSTFKFTLPI